MTTPALPLIIQSGVPALLIGEPGTGKSAWVRALGRAIDLPVEVLVGSVIDPTDVGGLPVADGDRARYLLPDWFVRLREAGRGILFLDELTCCSASVQAALLRLVQERSIHGHTLPAGVLIVAAANPPDQAAGGWDLAAPLANRFCHIMWQIDPQAWVEGMLAGWQDLPVQRLPNGWEARISQSRATVAGYVRGNPGALLQMPSEEARRSQPWASPRTWDLAARVQAACAAAEVDDSEALCGLIGEGAALAYVEWRQALDLPDPEALLRDPENHPLPERDDSLFVALSALAHVFCANPSKPRWEAAWTILGRVAQRAPDVGAIAARTIISARPKNATAPAGAAAYLPLIQAMGGAK